MKFIGYLFWVAGLILAGHALRMDTSVSVNYPDGNSLGLPERVNNFGLMNDKTNMLIYSGILVFFGTMMFYFSKPTKKKKVKNPIIIKTNTPANSRPSEKKYDNLEKIGNLLEKGLITNEEFEIEKKKILSDNIVFEQRGDHELPTVDSEIHEVVTTLKELIDKEKHTGLFGKSYRKEIMDFLSKSCSTKERSILIIEGYYLIYNADLIKDLISLSTMYFSIKELLTVFIDFGIVDENFPHEMKVLIG
jgi:hypothetical protein